MLVCLYKIWKVVHTEKIDIIHTHHRMAAFYARIISMLSKVKHVYTAHSIFYDKRKLMRYALGNCEIVAVGNGVKITWFMFMEFQTKELILYIIL